MASDLASRLSAASGADPGLDAAIAEALGVSSAPYTASVPDCRRLAAQLAPEARLHVGFGASGLFPYAAIIAADRRSVAEAPTVPLAVLRAVVGFAAGATR